MQSRRSAGPAGSEPPGSRSWLGGSAPALPRAARWEGSGRPAFPRRTARRPHPQSCRGLRCPLSCCRCWASPPAPSWVSCPLAGPLLGPRARLRPGLAGLSTLSTRCPPQGGPTSPARSPRAPPWALGHPLFPSRFGGVPGKLPGRGSPSFPEYLLPSTVSKPQRSPHPEVGAPRAGANGQESRRTQGARRE